MIKYWDYRRDYEADRSRILSIVDQVFSSGKVILGPAVSSFEAQFSAYCGTRYGIGANSGTDALFLSLKALGVGQGDEVITVSNTAVPTVAAIRAAGARPVFVDVEEDTFLMDCSRLEAAITGRTKCILPVHLYGQPVDMDAVLDIARAGNIFVIEDCAQAAGALYKGRKVGGRGDIGAFSFYPTKILGGYGDGGMAVTGEEEYDAKLRKLRLYGMRGAYCSEEEGFNSRLDEVHAAILSAKLQNLDKAVQLRCTIARCYADRLKSIGGIRVPAVRADRTHQFYVYTIKADRRDELQRYLLQHGIETRINYPSPVHLMPAYAFLGYREGDLPVTEMLADRILSLPMYSGLTSEEAEQVAEAVCRFYEAG